MSSVSFPWSTRKPNAASPAGQLQKHQPGPGVAGKKGVFHTRLVVRAHSLLASRPLREREFLGVMVRFQTSLVFPPPLQHGCPGWAEGVFSPKTKASALVLEGMWLKLEPSPWDALRSNSAYK